MLRIKIPGGEYFDNAKGEFYKVKDYDLRLEHSLISLTRWEQKYKRPYLSDKTGPKTLDETLYYFYCMSLDQSIPPYIFQKLSNEDYNRIIEYINDPMTATTIKERPSKKKQKPVILTSEVIYSYMAEFNLPFEVCEKWHLNNLLTLIKVCSENNTPPEKMSKAQTSKYYSELNKLNKARFHTKG